MDTIKIIMNIKRLIFVVSIKDVITLLMKLPCCLKMTEIQTQALPCYMKMNCNSCQIDGEIKIQCVQQNLD